MDENVNGDVVIIVSRTYVASGDFDYIIIT